ncbi:aminopeptidase [Thermodesulfobacteriota bacterium]
MLKRAVIGITLILILLVSGCRLVYIFHAAAGQYRLLHDSIQVEDALKSDSLDPDHKGRLNLVALIKDFGEKELGLKRTQNYQTVYLKSRQPPIYTVSASPKDRLVRISWWFPVVGNMPYLGFFNLESARKEKDRLVEKGLDVSTGVAEAYSTLGWFKDPVTLNLLEGSIVDLTETILHEMTHTTLYIKGQGEFNEGLANLVGKAGAIFFFKKTYGYTHPFTIEAENNLTDERIFSSFLGSLLENLERVYNSDLSYMEKLDKREKIFKKSLKEFAGIKIRFKADRFRHFGESGLNNAYLMSVGLYNRHFQLFESLLTKKDNSIRKMFIFFRDMTDEGGDILERIKTQLISCGHFKENGYKTQVDQQAYNII